MEPINSFPQGPERPQDNSSISQGEIFEAPKSVETQQAPVEQGKETREVFHDQPSADPTQAQVPPPPVLDVNLTTASQASATTTQQDDVTPVIAADVDLIEKEWVDKAKKIVSETKNDPYEQESAVGKLQADYLKKRYGRDIKLASDG